MGENHMNIPEAIDRILNWFDDGPVDVVATYNEYAQNGKYDKDIIFSDHQGTAMLGDELAKFFTPEKREHVEILDVGAGTGRAGAELNRRGYKKIDAVEPASEMLRVAQDRGVYRNCTCAGVSEKKLDIKENSYDVVCSVATFGIGHLPAIAIKEMYRLAKPGGVLAIVARYEDWELPEYQVKMNGLIHDLEKEGKLKIFNIGSKPGYMFRNTPKAMDAIVIILQKTKKN